MRALRAIGAALVGLVSTVVVTAVLGSVVAHMIDADAARLGEAVGPVGFLGGITLAGWLARRSLHRTEPDRTQVTRPPTSAWPVPPEQRRRVPPPPPRPAPSARSTAAPDGTPADQG